MIGRLLFGLTLVLAPQLLVGCRAPAPKEEAAQPFVFRSLNLRQKDPSGRPLWELSSPEARYDLGRRVAQARDLRGVIYAKGTALYRITATSGTVINDGEVVQLEGPTLLQRIGPKPLRVSASRVRWYPKQERMEIDRHPRASQGDLRLTAQRARFWIQQDKLELLGRPVLQRTGASGMTLTLSSADWFPGTGQLLGRGPVRGERRLPGNGLQTLSSPGLTGNSLSQIIDLQSPVQLLDPGRKAKLDARQTRIQLADERISSPHPFTARLDQSLLTGIGFEVLGPIHTLIIPQACRLNQPTDSLRADRCSWNWQTNQAEATGSVELRRQAFQQVTRAQRLTGVVSKQGQAVFSDPGSRVQTRMTLPPARSRPQTSERKAPPISL
ncbi:MAG: LPS export ABC transporter periplasmic protein LptC [Cyanobium sp. LacPavin_0818_WC50_MAG_67_9]|nr:LPS export ABC transporter periplasmic protein LptC [Cyanobium sp. LacPavin_0818_WC50_MAG_67_9]